MVTDPKDDDDKWMEYRHPRQRQLQREKAETLAMLKMMSPMVDDPRYAYEVRDALDTEGSRDGNGGVRLHAGAADHRGGGMSAHPTPGPWVAKARATGGYNIVSVDDVLEDVVVGVAVLGDHSLETAYANAQMLAAGPILAKALQRMISHYAMLPASMDEPGSVMNEAREALLGAGL